LRLLIMQSSPASRHFLKLFHGTCRSSRDTLGTGKTPRYATESHWVYFISVGNTRGKTVPTFWMSFFNRQVTM
jgi:hypothetical protein